MEYEFSIIIPVCATIILSGFYILFRYISGLTHRLKFSEKEACCAKTTLKTSHNLFKGIINSTDNLIVAIDLKYNLTAFNKSFEETCVKFWGKRPQIGMSLFALLNAFPEQKESYMNVWRRVLLGENFKIIQEFGDSTHSHNSFFEFNFTALRNPVRQMIGAVGMGCNVDERVKHELQLMGERETLKIQNYEVRLMNEMSVMLKRCFSSEETFNYIEIYAQRILSHSAGILYLAREKRFLDVATFWGNPQQKPFSFQIEECWALKRGQSHVLNNPHSGLICGHQQTVENLTISSLCIPIIKENHLIGLFYIEAKKSFTKQQQLLAEVLVAHIALAFGNLNRSLGVAKRNPGKVQVTLT